MTENIILSPVPDLSDLASSAVWSVRYRDPSGFDCQLSLESASGVEVLQRAQAALAKLSESGCTPISKPQISSAIEGDTKAESVICPIHNVAMRQYQKDGRSWYAHRLEDGSWCRGKAHDNR
jgi:hypothetical protein